jgi:alpha-galactosidase
MLTTLSLLWAGMVGAAGPAEALEATAVRATTLAPTPPMGFNDWNAFGCDVNETLIKETADFFVSSGLKNAGYQYVNIDDCWALKDRGADGRLVPDPAKFPSGIKGVADYVHGLGLKLGIYGDAGTKTCAGYPGSLGHEVLDAQTWAGWGVDYLKYDNCYNQSDGSREDYVRRYTAMRQALDQAGRPIVFSICEWGSSQPWEWAADVGDLWRTGGDISDNWASVRSIIAHNATLAQFAGPGNWNDPDMLEIGNGGMTATEYRTHMSMWAMMAAPLIIGTDLRTASAETLAILENRDVIGIDQDRLGRQAAVISDSGGLMVLDKPLVGGDHAIALYNSTDSLATVSVPATDTGVRPAAGYRLTDIWTGRSLQAKRTIAAAVPAHGTVVYRVRPLARPGRLAPSVTVAGVVGTLIPAVAEGNLFNTTVTNRGAGPISKVKVSVTVPEGWTVTPAGSAGRKLATDAALATSWTVHVPAGTVAGPYPITVTAAYTWGPRSIAGRTSSEIVGLVVNPPPDGNRYLGSLLPVTSTNTQGPIELDMSNGGEAAGDGSLITIGGKVYTRGLGTSAASKLEYFLDGKCSKLTADVGIDDEVTTSASASFTIYADDKVAARSAELGVDDAAQTLTADLTGATWLELATDPGGSGDGAGDHTDWAVPILTCGADPGDVVQPVERTVFSFEDGTDGFTTANPDSGGTVAQTTAFHTDGEHGLDVVTPTEGNWYGKPLAEPLDLTGNSMLKFDVRAGATGTTGEIAVQVGADSSWCQGSLWAWTNAGSSKTIKARFADLGCPAGVTLDLSQIRAVWVFLNGGSMQIDNIRAE